MSAEETYAILGERLGYAGSARFRLILEELMTPDEARMVVELPGTPQEVAEKTGFDQNRVKDTLDELFFKGVVFPRGDFRKREYFRFARSSGQFFESTMARAQCDPVRDSKFFKLWHDFSMNEFYPNQAKNMTERSKRGERPSQRIVPAYKSIKDLPGVLPYENYPELLRAQERITTVPCACRYMETAVGHRCTVHDEETHWVCLQFGRGAEYASVSESGRELSIEEALELSDLCEDNGLLHSVNNHSAMTGFNTSCNCCRDCCMLYIPVDQAELNIGLVWEKSRYEAYVNQGDCDGCQDCVDRCLFDAIEMVQADGSKKLKAVVDPELCWGCGVCVVGCDPAALKMKVVRPPEHIPAAPTK